MQFKSDVVVGIIANFASYVQTQFQTSIQCIRLDDAKELCEGPMLQCYLSHGIVHQKSCVNSPQQNGTIERKHMLA